MIAGSGRAKLDDDIIELRVSDVLRVPPAVIRSFEAGPDGLDVICIGGRKPKDGDTEKFDDPGAVRRHLYLGGNLEAIPRGEIGKARDVPAARPRRHHDRLVGS